MAEPGLLRLSGFANVSAHGSANGFANGLATKPAPGPGLVPASDVGAELQELFTFTLDLGKQVGLAESHGVFVAPGFETLGIAEADRLNRLRAWLS